MIYLVLAILVMEIIRLAVQLYDSSRVNRLNAKITERLESQYKEMQVIRKAEIEELKELAKGSKYLEGMMDSFKLKDNGTREE